MVKRKAVRLAIRDLRFLSAIAATVLRELSRRRGATRTGNKFHINACYQEPGNSEVCRRGKMAHERRADKDTAKFGLARAICNL